jgi:plastocyanin
MALNFPGNPVINDTYTIDNTTWEWNGVSWNLVGSIADSGEVTIPSDISELSDNSSIIPDDISDLTDITNLIPNSLLDLSIVDGSDGQVLTTNGAGNFTFATVTGGDGGSTLQNLYSTIEGDTGSTTASNSSDTLTIQGGTNITTSAANGTVTINFSGTYASQLSDFVTAGLTIDKIYEPAIVMLRVDNNGTSAYTFNSHYSGNNPTIYAISGTTIAFDLDGIAGHPFEIQDSLGTTFNTGLVHVSSTGVVSTGADAQGKSSGTLYWRIPETTSSPPNFRYQCQLHASMVGAITIKDLSAI